MDDRKLQEVIMDEKGDKPPMEKIYEGPNQPEERVQYSDKLEEVEQDAEDGEMMPEVISGFFVPRSRKFMKEALKQARIALIEDEVPVGAVIVKDGEIISAAHNRREHDQSVASHAEILAIKEAGRKLKDWRLTECEIYITLEPCPMCLGALLQTNIKKIVYGAAEPKTGAVESRVNLLRDFKSGIEVIGGVCEEQSQALLKSYFKEKR